MVFTVYRWVSSQSAFLLATVLLSVFFLYLDTSVLWRWSAKGRSNVVDIVKIFSINRIGVWSLLKLNISNWYKGANNKINCVLSYPKIGPADMALASNNLSLTGQVLPIFGGLAGANVKPCPVLLIVLSLSHWRSLQGLKWDLVNLWSLAITKAAFWMFNFYLQSIWKCVDKNLTSNFFFSCQILMFNALGCYVMKSGAKLWEEQAGHLPVVVVEALLWPWQAGAGAISVLPWALCSIVPPLNGIRYLLSIEWTCYIKHENWTALPQFLTKPLSLQTQML